jgi:predicted AAA+ superfamily ATPase
MYSVHPPKLRLRQSLRMPQRRSVAAEQVMSKESYTRPQAAGLLRRLGKRRRFMQVVTGARQVGKTDSGHQGRREGAAAVVFVSVDEPTLRGSDWIDAQWEAARPLLRDTGERGALLVLEEVQKVPHWSEAVKRLWDADTRARRPLKVALLGSAPLLVQRGLTESLAGRFEVVHLPHWTWAEMEEAFDWNVEQHLFYGVTPEPRRSSASRIDGHGTSVTR